MDAQKPNQKIASIRTYAQDLTSAREKRGTATPVKTSTAVMAEQKPKVTPKAKDAKVVITPNKSGLPPKVFARSAAISPLPQSAPQEKLNTLIKTELQSEATHAKKVSVDAGVENASFVVDNADAAAATIITDTKKDRFKLFPSLFASFTNWFAELRRAQARKNVPRYTVPETSRRKGVIQKATSSTGKTASADFSSIQERIRQRKLAEVNTPTTTWSANTETGFLLLEAPEIDATNAGVHNVKIVPKKSVHTDTPKADPLPTGPSGFEDPAYLASHETQTPKVSTPAPVAKTDPAPTPVMEVVPEVPEPSPVVATPVVAPVSEEPEIENAQEESEPVAVSLVRLDTNFLALVTSAIALVLIGVGIYVYQTVTPNVITDIQTPAQKIFPESELEIINLGELTQQELTTKLLGVREEVTVATEVATHINATELDPTDLILLINPQLQLNFAHSLTLVRAGYSSEQVPFLAFGITDAITARGGMLTWEGELYQDFARTFGTNIPTPTTPKFIDASLAGIDIRVLKNTSGQEVLLYGILDSTILITTDSMTFAALLPLITK